MSQSVYNPTSPYATTPQIYNYLPYLDSWDNSVQIIPSQNDTYYQVTANYQHRPDLLSFDLYGTTGYWWVFAMRNPDIIKDPIYDLIAGINIYLPDKSVLPLAGS